MNKQAQCNLCSWCRPGGTHIGCYAGDRWRKWIPKKEFDVPRECKDFKGFLKLTEVDDIDKLLEMQKDLMKHVPYRISDKIVFQMTAGLGIIEETLEYLNAIGRKPWRPHPQTQEQQLEEITDILFYYLELILLSGFTWEDIVIEYKRKHKINLKRYEDGAKGDFSWDDKGTKGEL